MNCESSKDMRSILLSGLEYSIALVTAADDNISKAEEDEIANIVKKDFFARLIENSETTQQEFITKIIALARKMVAASDLELEQIFNEEATPAILHTVQMLGSEGRDCMLATIESIATSDGTMSEDEAKMINLIISILDVIPICT